MPWAGQGGSDDQYNDFGHCADDSATFRIRMSCLVRCFSVLSGSFFSGIERRLFSIAPGFSLAGVEGFGLGPGRH